MWLNMKTSKHAYEADDTWWPLHLSLASFSLYSSRVFSLCSVSESHCDFPPTRSAALPSGLVTTGPFFWLWKTSIWCRDCSRLFKDDVRVSVLMSHFEVIAHWIAAVWVLSEIIDHNAKNKVKGHSLSTMHHHGNKSLNLKSALLPFDYQRCAWVVRKPRLQHKLILLQRFEDPHIMYESGNGNILYVPIWFFSIYFSFVFTFVT